MVRVELVYPLGMKRGFLRDEFCKAVENSRCDRAEGTGCVGTILSDVL